MNCPHWLLALTIPFSRSNRARTSTAGVDAGCAEGLLRTMPASLLQLPEGLGGPFRRECHCSRRVTERQRVQGAEFLRMMTRERPLQPPIVAGHPPLPTDARPSGPVPSRESVTAHHLGGMREATCAFRMPPGARDSTGFSSPTCRQTRRFGGRAPPADAVDLPHVTTMRCLEHAPPLLHGRDRAVTLR
jgi:hypothetical protein